MSDDITALEPRAVWRYFAELSAIPRPSQREERAAAYVEAFGRRLGLGTTRDAVGNVILRKPATPGMENRLPIVLQGHLDMVCQKNAETDFDFDNQGIDLYLEGDWVKAHGTTLGADNGIGVAATLAVLASDEIPHPAIEALFTVNEENGMTGALGLQPGQLSGAMLLNLDTEDDGELTIGCAGAVNVTATGDYPQEPGNPDDAPFRLTLKGLGGGHSGMDIHRGRGNANRLLARLLLVAEPLGLRVAAIDSGGLRNAIPREGTALFVVDPGRADALRERIEAETDALRTEHAETDPHLEVSLIAAERPASVMEPGFQARWLRAVHACPNGIFRMSPSVPGLVQTSNNLARVQAADGRYELLCLTRGALDSEKMDLAAAIRGLFELLGADVALSGAYPGWAPQPDSDLVRLMAALYEERHGDRPQVLACHAGLECGIIGHHYPGMQMISFGPNIRGAHSPDERVQVSSVQKFWAYLLDALRRIPECA